VAPGLADRLIRVLLLDGSVFDEVARDADSTGQAVGVVLAAGVATGIGRWGAEGLGGLLSGVVDGGLLWMLWVVAVHVIARLAALPSDPAGLHRALGFAFAPFALGALGILPWIGGLFGVMRWPLVFAAFVLAVSRVLGVSSRQAVLVAAAGLALALLVATPVTWIHPS
jgi:hypothetical protein